MTQPQADLVKASLESAERLQNQQLVAIRSVIDRQSKSAGELSRAKTMDELLAVQTRLVGQQLEHAASLWSDFCQAAGENQRVAIGRDAGAARAGARPDRRGRAAASGAGGRGDEGATG